jgi:hypothetical protein
MSTVEPPVGTGESLALHELRTALDEVLEHGRPVAVDPFLSPLPQRELFALATRIVRDLSADVTIVTLPGSGLMFLPGTDG